MSGKSASGKCPICESDTVEGYRPFCSKRCADVDLHRWLNGSYAIPGEEDESGAEFETPEAPVRLH
ncbi:MAG: DNA gyrase inhibitor YacG [Aquisalinus sp.]|nr:DNA gyrase inhibitor YacG [Aquisalinus sp.]